MLAWIGGSDRGRGRDVIAPRRSSSAHFHRPWRATVRFRSPSWPAVRGRRISDSIDTQIQRDEGSLNNPDIAFCRPSGRATAAHDNRLILLLYLKCRLSPLDTIPTSWYGILHGPDAARFEDENPRRGDACHPRHGLLR